MPRYEKGTAPGPGRPKGSRNKATIWLDQLGRDGVEKIIGVVKKKANGGDLRACGLVLARAWPSQRGRTLELDLPRIVDSAGVVEAQAELVACLSRGELTPDEAASISTLLENQRRAIELHDYGLRMAALERKAAEGRDTRTPSPAELLAEPPLSPSGTDAA